MNNLSQSSFQSEGTMEITAFRLQDQEFSVKTTTIREIRGWGPATPLPHSPPEVIGVMNLRGSVIPIIDLAHKLGMPPAQPTVPSAIVVTEAHGMVIGLLVDGVSDILTLPATLLQPIPVVEVSSCAAYADRIITHVGR
jgi:purine-binding chemotaxis protein CheW